MFYSVTFIIFPVAQIVLAVAFGSHFDLFLCPFETSAFFFFLRIFVFSELKICFMLILSLPCASPGINHVSKKLCFLSLLNDYLKVKISVHWDIISFRFPLANRARKYKYSYINNLIYVSIYK